MRHVRDASITAHASWEADAVPLLLFSSDRPLSAGDSSISEFFQ
jgi:hypothetical protein